MNKYITAILIGGVALMSACKKNVLDPVSFDVSTAKTTYKVGDTVYFDFRGNPDFITFYSGEQGKVYENVGRLIQDGTPKLQFTSARANGTQAGSLMVMVSSDYVGVSTDSATNVANFTKATWTDITSKATLSTGAAVSSGAIDLSDFKGKPVYIAFKYVAAAGTTQNKWTITNLTVNNNLADGSVYTIANLSNIAITNYAVSNTISPGWINYRVSNNYNWVITSGTSLVITGATSAAQATAPAEAWTITGSINLKTVSPDLGTFVKGMDTRASNFYYVYTKAGTYTATFTAVNSKLTETKEDLKKITLTITP